MKRLRFPHNHFEFERDPLFGLDFGYNPDISEQNIISISQFGRQVTGMFAIGSNQRADPEIPPELWAINIDEDREYIY